MPMARKTRMLAEEAFRLHVLQGKTQRQTAEAIGRALSSTNRLLRSLEDEWHKELTSDVYRIKVTQTKVHEHIAREALDAWERSKLDEETEKLVAFGDKNRSRKEKTSKGQAGDAQFLRVAMDALAKIREIWGMDAPQKLEHTGRDGKPLFDSEEQNLLSDPRVAELACLMEERLQEMEYSRGSADAPGPNGTTSRGPSTDNAGGNGTDGDAG